jgi:hypothetical protein
MSTAALSALNPPVQAKPERFSLIDPVFLLAVYVVLLIMVPANKVFEPFGGSASPAELYGVVLFGIWLLLRVSRSPRVRSGFGPLHVAWLIYATALVASYYAATSTSVAPIEARGGDRGMLGLVSSSGLFLLAADGLRTRRQLGVILRFLAAALCVEAFIALTQYFLQVNWYVNLPFPILTTSWTAAIDTRSGFLRTTGTAVHAIEFGVVMMMGLALLLHWARFAVGSWSRRGWWAASALVMMTAPLSVARSPMVALLVVAAMVVPTWPRTWRMRALVITPFALLLMRLAFPGTLGTIRSLFQYVAEDPSVAGRTSDYDQLGTLLAGHEWFGRGIGTVIPQIYITLDNEYLSALLDAGVLGLIATLGLLLASTAIGLSLRARLPDEDSRSLTHALTTGITVAAITWALFDGFAFRQASAVLLLFMGCLAALQNVAESPAAPQRRDWRAVAAGGLTATLVMAYGFLSGPPRGEYHATAHQLIRHSDPSAGLFASDTSAAAALLAEWLRTSEARRIVAEGGGTAAYSISQGQGSLAPATDSPGLGPIINIRAVSSDPHVAEKTAAIAQAVLEEHLVDQQKQAGAPASQELTAQPILDPLALTWQGGSPARAKVALVVLSGLSGLAVGILVSCTRRGSRKRNRPSSMKAGSP